MQLAEKSATDARGAEIKPGDRVVAPRLNGVRFERVSSISDDGQRVRFVSGRSEIAERVARLEG